MCGCRGLEDQGQRHGLPMQTASRGHRAPGLLRLRALRGPGLRRGGWPGNQALSVLSYDPTLTMPRTVLIAFAAALLSVTGCGKEPGVKSAEAAKDDVQRISDLVTKDVA